MCIIDTINEAEELFPVDQWKINGIHIWPIIRTYLIFAKTGKKSHMEGKIFRIISRIKSILQNLVLGGMYYIFKTKKLPHHNCRKEILFMSYGVFRNYYKNIWYNIHLDPIVECMKDLKLHYSFLDMEKRYYKLPAYEHYYFTHKYLWIHIKSKLKQRFLTSCCHVKNATLFRYDDFLNFLTCKKIAVDGLQGKQFDLKLNIFLQYVNGYLSLLQKIKPGVVFMTCYYSLHGMAMNLACRNLGITSIDVQHGVQGSHHPAYGRWNKMPTEGYALLPRMFWVWGKHECEAIESWSQNTKGYHKPIIGGNILLHKWIDIHNSDINHFVHFYDKKLKHIIAKSSNHKHVLLTLQPNIGDMDFLISIMKNSQNFCYWWIRLHPGMRKQEKSIIRILKRAKIYNANVNLSTSYPLYAILKHMELHVTVSSTVVIEAAYFGVPSIMLGSLAKNYYRQQIEDGIAVFENKEEKVLEKLRVLRKRSDSELISNADSNIPLADTVLKIIGN